MTTPEPIKACDGPRDYTLAERESYRRGFDHANRQHRYDTGYHGYYRGFGYMWVWILFIFLIMPALFVGSGAHHFVGRR